MVRIPGSNIFPLACRSRAILPTLVGLCLLRVVLVFLQMEKNKGEIFFDWTDSLKITKPI